MKKPTIEQLLIASMPPDSDRDHPFVQNVMRSIRKGKEHASFRQVLRDTNVPAKRTFITKLRHLPKFALVALAIFATFVITGTAYAAYQLWRNPRTHTESLQENDKRRAAVINLENCKDLGDQATFEIKRGSSLKPEEIEKLVQAKCELDAITNWANNTWKTDWTAQQPTQITAFPAPIVQDISPDKISLAGENNYQQTFAITNQTVFVQGGQHVSRKTIKKGDLVAPAVRYYYADKNGGAPTKSELLAVVKLDLPARYYSWQLQYEITQRTSCFGNTQETCTHGSLVDVFPRNEALTLPYPRPSGEGFEIQGEIVSLEGKRFKLKGSSGKLYTIQTTEDVIGTFNTTVSQAYGLTIELGDMLLVRYAQDSGSDPQNVGAEEVLVVQLVTELTNKTHDLKKY